jgi:AraC-like DNA-binding protein
VKLDGPVQCIGRAIELLQRRYQQPLRIEELAEVSHMSLCTFYARFKTVTLMSPLQFQKRLRLHEALRLLMSDWVDVTTAAHRIGYESLSQFTREYRRLFGSPPRREIAVLRQGRVNTVGE